MRITSIVCLCLFIFSCSDGPATDLDLNKLKGNVKFVEKKLYAAGLENGEIKKQKLETIYAYYFNREGYLTEYVVTIPEYEFSEHYLYDGVGHIKTYYNVDEGDTLVNRCSLVLDDNSNVLEEIWLTNEGEVQMRYVNIFNSNGDIIGTKAFREQDTFPELKQEYELDNKGNRTAILFYDKNDVIAQKNLQQFDKDGNLTRLDVQRRVSDKFLSSPTEYVYSDNDQQGNWQKQISKIYRGEEKVPKSYKYMERRVEYY